MKNLQTKVASFALASAMALSTSGMAVFAAGEGTTIDVTKTVETDGKTMAPNTTFTFEVSAGSAGNYDGNVVYAGVEGGLTGTTITFAPDGATPKASYTEKGQLSTDASVFTRPGVYAYTVKEAASNYEGITTDAKTYTVYVYVVNDGAGYKVSNVVADNKDSKTNIEFSNDYGKDHDTTHDVTLTKVITGNQSKSDDTFKFDVTVNGQTGEQYYVEYTHHNGTAATTWITSGTTITLDGISNNDTIKINGLSNSDTYTFKEQDNTDGYEVTYENATGNAKADGTKATATNKKDMNTPTGIFMSYMPYFMMVVLAAGFFFVSRRNKTREEL